jgi:hypothetical protein
MQSKNLAMAREELENPPVIKKKQESPSRPKSAPPKSTGRIRTVSPIVTKTRKQPLSANVSKQSIPFQQDFMSLDEEQMSLHFAEKPIHIQLAADDAGQILQIPPIAKTSGDNLLSVSAEWSDHSDNRNENKNSDDVNYSVHIKQLSEEYTAISSRIQFLEHESQMEQKKTQIIHLKQENSGLSSKIQQLEIDLACSKSETDEIKKQFEQYKLENERIQADLRVQISKLAEERFKSESEKALSNRLFKIEQKYTLPKENTTQNLEESGLYPITPREDEDDENYQLHEPPRPLFTFDAKSLSSISTNSTMTPKKRSPDPRYSPENQSDVSPYVTYMSKIPSPHPMPRHPKVDSLASAMKEVSSVPRLSDQGRFVVQNKVILI